MGLDNFDNQGGAETVEPFYDTVYRQDTVQKYSFDCTNCGNEMKKETTGDYAPKTHICLECLTPHWVWPNGDSSWDDEIVVREI